MVIGVILQCKFFGCKNWWIETFLIMLTMFKRKREYLINVIKEVQSIKFIPL